jgi:hypothetical protein
LIDFPNELENLLDLKIDCSSKFKPWIMEEIEKDFVPFKEFLEKL